MSLDRNLTQADKVLDRSAKAVEKRLLDNYRASLKEVQSQIAKVAYEKHDGSFTALNKYKRLEGLEKSITKEVGKLTGQSASTLKAGLGRQYEESFYRTAFAVESEAQAKLGFSQLSENVIKRSVENPLDRVGFLKRNRNNGATLARQLQERLTQGLIQGKSYQQVARDIKERMDVGATNVQRIAQTEMHRVQMEGRLDALEHAADKGVIMKKQWVSTLDDRTRDSHQSLDGQKVAIDEQFEIRGSKADAPGGFGVPEEDINCRCTMISVIEGYEPEVRRAREDGVIPYTNYPDYAEAKGWPRHYDGPEKRGA